MSASSSKENTHINLLLSQHSIVQLHSIQQQGLPVSAVSGDYRFEVLSVVEVFHFRFLLQVGFSLFCV